MRRRRPAVWGTYCRACRTVRLRSPRIVCHGPGWGWHTATVIEVLDAPDGTARDHETEG